MLIKSHKIPKSSHQLGVLPYDVHFLVSFIHLRACPMPDVAANIKEMNSSFKFIYI